LFCALDEDEAGAHDAGGQAVASYLLGGAADSEARSVVSLSWEVAFRRRTEAPAAIELEPELAEEDDPTDDGPRRMRRLKPRQKRIRTRPRSTHKQGSSAPDERRELVSLDELDLTSVSAGFFDGKRRGTLQIPRSVKLREPRKVKPDGEAAQTSTTSVHRSYTDAAREEAGYRIMEAVLGDTEGLVLDDLRTQDGVGADAVDRERDIWLELKAHGLDPADTVQLEPSEAKRAREKRDKYWLVIAWNLEKPRTPAFVVIPDPLRRLDTYLGRGLKLTGVQEVVVAPTATARKSRAATTVRRPKRGRTATTTSAT
jgi:hypothetical protein